MYLLKHNSEVGSRVHDFVEFLKRKTGEKVKCLHSYNNGEYVLKNLIDYLLQRGI